MKENYRDLIERYFDDQLSEEERGEVERLRTSNVDFQQEFELFEKANKAVKISTLLDLKADVKSIHQEMKAPKQGKSINLKWWSLAAGIALLVGLWSYAQQFSNANIYADAYTPVEDYVTNMDQTVSEMERAMELLDHKDYDKAISAFEKLYSSTGNLTALFYEGHCYYEVGEYTKAIDHWNKVTNEYQPEAQWYTALVYLKLDDVERAKASLNQIVEAAADEKFVLKAKELNSKLSSPFRVLVF